MEAVLYYIAVAMMISIVVNLILKRGGISPIIGYIMTGVAVAYGFDLHHVSTSKVLMEIAEFGVVFLMFTIGLEMSLQSLWSMKREVFVNGLLQVLLSSLLFYSLAHWALGLRMSTSVIIAMALSLSSTAVVLTHLKATKEIHRPYGQNALGILIFQDIAVIPILLLIGFMSVKSPDVSAVLRNTGLSLGLILVLLFVVGKPLMTRLLHFAARSHMEELFMGSVLVIVVGSSLLAHHFGFTHSLGAFLAGMIIAKTEYHHKVESDIAPFKDLLLGTFFVTVGMKIDLAFLSEHLWVIVQLLVGIMVFKASIIFAIISFSTKAKTGLKTALALSQVGEFSFAIFALADNAHLIHTDVVQYLILSVVLSLILTPFILQTINHVIMVLFKEKTKAEDFTPVANYHAHVIVCGYSVLGRFVAEDLVASGYEPVVVDNHYRHVREALRDGRDGYYGDMSKRSILDLLQVREASMIIVTLDNFEKKLLICEAIAHYHPQARVIVSVLTLEEQEALSHLPIAVSVDSKKEMAHRLVSRSLVWDEG